MGSSPHSALECIKARYSAGVYVGIPQSGVSVAVRASVEM